MQSVLCSIELFECISFEQKMLTYIYKIDDTFVSEYSNHFQCCSKVYF